MNTDRVIKYQMISQELDYNFLKQSGIQLFIAKALSFVSLLIKHFAIFYFYFSLSSKIKHS